MRQSASLTAGSRDASSTGDRRAAHTPGPWRVERDDDDEVLDITTASRLGYIPIATLKFGYNEPIESDQHANARLIAAAPAMLAALQVVLAITEDFLTDPTQHQDHILTALDGVRAAIALSDHQNAPTDDATGQRSGLSP